jgi:hypothetical protein
VTPKYRRNINICPVEQQQPHSYDAGIPSASTISTGFEVFHIAKHFGLFVNEAGTALSELYSTCDNVIEV